MGAVAYLVSVILLSYRSLEADPVSKNVCLVVGLVSMSTAAGTIRMTLR